METVITESQWIDHFNFGRFPFDRPEAGNEEFSRPDFLAQCFVEPSNFERIFGHPDAPSSALFFADRGTGKTACRVMMNYFCQIGFLPRSNFEGRTFILSVPHIHLYRVWELAKAFDNSFPTAQNHAFEILCRAMPELARMIAQEPTIERQFRELPEADKFDLSWLVMNFGMYLSAFQNEVLKKAGIAWPPSHNLGYPLFKPELSSSGQRKNYKTPKGKELLSPLDHLSNFAKLLRGGGISAIYVLVDGLDEFDLTANDPDKCHLTIRSLLTNLKLMDGTPYLTFKLFLPSQVLQPILSDTAIRKDRGFIVEHLVWKEEHLVEILRRRLAAVSVVGDRNQPLFGFEAICVPELRGSVESQLVRVAEGNPRHLLLLCGWMTSAHLNSPALLSQDDVFLLNQDDLQNALQEFMRFKALLNEIEMRHTVGDDDVLNLKYLAKLIGNRENERVEFKARLRHDLKTNSVNKELQLKIARSVAGMMNRHGGVLLIGVQDNGEMAGVDDEVLLLAKPTLDRFQLELTDVLEEHLGKANLESVRVRFIKSNDRHICVIDIQESRVPVYVKMAGQSEFWLRTGNKTRQLDAREAQEYWQTRHHAGKSW